MLLPLLLLVGKEEIKIVSYQMGSKDHFYDTQQQRSSALLLLGPCPVTQSVGRSAEEEHRMPGALNNCNFRKRHTRTRGNSLGIFVGRVQLQRQQQQPVSRI